MLGLGKLPLDGNPYRYAGIIGHANEISNITLSHQGGHLLTAGGSDGVVNLWSLNTSGLDSQINNGGEGMEPFYQMIDPVSGSNGEIIKEFEDYFYYSQIKAYVFVSCIVY